MTQLRTKFVRTLLMVCALIAVPTVVIVVYSSVQTFEVHSAEVDSRIRSSIASKGRVLSENHAIALRGLTLDNAFTDIQELVARAVRSDADLVYGVYIAADGGTLAYVTRDEAERPAAPVTEAWARVGLSKEQFFVEELSQRDTFGNGDPVMEIAAPVMGEEPSDPPLGTIRYGFSLGATELALATAKAESASELKKTLTLLLSSIGIAAALGLLLSRRQASHITKPITHLTRAANALAAGRRDVSVNIDSGDELGVLGSAFNTMVGELDSSYSKLEEVNRTLERRVEDRTKELSQKNRDMRAVLDNVDQGLLTLSARGAIVGGCSKALETWFGPMPVGALLSEVSSRVSPEFASEFELGWEQLVSEFLPLELCIDQLPSSLKLNQRVWNLRYLPLEHDGKFDGLLVIVAEITELLAKQAEEASARELIMAFKQVMSDRVGFKSFAHWAAQVIASLDGKSERGSNDGERARKLHTLKGTAAVLGLDVVASYCHDLEDEFASTGGAAASTLAKLNARWSSLTAQLDGFLSAKDDTLEVSEDDYNLVTRQLERDGAAPDLVARVRSWRWRPVSSYLAALSDQALGLAKRLGKEPLDISVVEPGLRVDPERWDALMGELGHIVRNAVDHGIEPSDERKLSGKAPRGKLNLRAELSRGEFTLEIGDDGSGLDVAALRKRGATFGHQAITDDDAIGLVFLQGLSTREPVGLVSGRGVGMAAVRSAVESQGGSIRVTTQSGRGTRWTLRFPAEAVGDSVWMAGESLPQHLTSQRTPTTLTAHSDARHEQAHDAMYSVPA